MLWDHCRSINRAVNSLNLLAIISILILLQRVGSMPCPLSQTFVQYVDQCPRNSLEWNARSAIHNCSSVNQTCVKNDMFVYHCVLNSNGTMLIEVCAPLKKIYGQNCAEFDSKGNIIQENSNNCSNAIVPCPGTYISTDAFKYQSCYDNVKKKTKSASINETIHETHKTETNEASGYVDIIIILSIVCALLGCTIAIMIFYHCVKLKKTNLHFTSTLNDNVQNEHCQLRHSSC